MSSRTLDLNLVPVFMAIMEELNLSRAAERLKISQPAVSQALRKLRDTYDDELFIRTSNGVHPTLIAQDIYPTLRDAQRQITLTLPAQRVFDPASSQRHFSIAVLSLLNYTLMPLLADTIRQRAPSITIEIHPLFSDDLAQDLRTRKYDLAIDIHKLETRSVQQELLMKDRLVVVCSQDHPRIRETLSHQQYLHEMHVIHTYNNRSTSHLEAAGIKELKDRKVAWKAPGLLEILPIISGSEWLATIPDGLAKRYAKFSGLKYFEPTFDTGSLPIFMSWHPSLSSDKAHLWLRQQLHEAASGLI